MYFKREGGKRQRDRSARHTHIDIYVERDIYMERQANRQGNRETEARKKGKNILSELKAS